MVGMFTNRCYWLVWCWWDITTQRVKSCLLMFWLYQRYKKISELNKIKNLYVATLIYLKLFKFTNSPYKLETPFYRIITSFGLLRRVVNPNIYRYPTTFWIDVPAFLASQILTINAYWYWLIFLKLFMHKFTLSNVKAIIKKIITQYGRNSYYFSSYLKINYFF